MGAFDEEFLKRVDAAAFGVPRTRFVQRVLEKALPELEEAARLSRVLAGDDLAQGVAPAGIEATLQDRGAVDRRGIPASENGRGAGPFGCPEPMCLKRGRKEERCPVHGTLLTFKL